MEKDTVLEGYFGVRNCPELQEQENKWMQYAIDHNIGSERGFVRDMIYWDVMEKKYEATLQRFLIAQESVYETALAEVKNGRKVTHWIWFIFPQMKGLGKSERSEYYGITDRNEAEAYMANPVLSKRLVEITQAVVDSPNSVPEIFGPDAIKVYSCMKLFSSVSDHPVFKKLMQKECWH